MKKTISFLLAISLLFLLTACGEKTPAPEPAPGTEPTQTAEPAQPTESEPAEPAAPASPTVAELDEETLQKALQAVMMAYYYHNPYTQYDASCLTCEPKLSGSPRRTTFMPPEGAAYDTQHYSQCTEFAFDIYYEAFGWDGWIGARSYYNTSMPQEQYRATLVTGYDPDFGLNDLEAATKILAEESRPGDVILGYGSLTGDSGHVMVVLGDYYGDGRNLVIHSFPVNSGGNLDEKTGADKPERKGALVIQTMEDLVLTEDGYAKGEPNYCVLTKRGGPRWYLFRPLLHEGVQSYSLTPATLSRMQYPDLCIEKAADRSIYDDVREGEDVTVTETLKNNGKTDYEPITVVEYIPEGAVLRSASEGCTVDGNKLTWTLTVKAGKSEKISYTVTNQLKRGAELHFSAGLVDQIPSREFTLRVGGAPLSKSQLAALKTVADGVTPALLREEKFADLDFVNRFYKEILGAEIGLPKTVDEFVSSQFEAVNRPGMDAKVLKIRETVDARYQSVREMAIQKGLTGYNVTYGTTPQETAGRLMEIQPEYLTAGDVVICMGNSESVSRTSVLDEKDITIYLFLGGKTVLVYDTNGARLDTFANTVTPSIVRNVCAILRPTMGFDDISANVPIPEASSLPIADEAALRAAASSGDTLKITENITLSSALDLSDCELILAAGKTFDIGDFDVPVRMLRMEDGAVLAAGKGRIVLTARDDLSLASLLETFAGQNVRIVCSETDISNVYECAEKVALYTAPAAQGEKNLASLTAVLTEGWTIRMTDGIVASNTLSFAHPGVTIDLNGNRLGLFNFGKTDFSVIDSSAGNGLLIFRGKGTLSDDTQTGSIYAPGIRVQVGFNSSVASVKTNSSALKIAGTLTCGTIELLNGSTIEAVGEGKIVTDTPLPAAPAAGEDGVYRVSEDTVLTDHLALSQSKLVVAAGKTLDLGEFSIPAKAVELEAGAKITGTTGRVVLSSANDKETAALVAALGGNAVLVRNAYSDADIHNEYDCLTKTVQYTSAASVGVKNMTSIFSVVTDGWTVRMNDGLVASATLNIANPGVTLDLNGWLLGLFNYTGSDFSVIDSGETEKGRLIFRGKGKLSDDTVAVSIYAPDVTVQVGYTTGSGTENSSALKISGTITCKELSLLNGSTAEPVGAGRLVTP